MNYYLDVLKKYAVFGGRAARKEYWMFVLFNVIVSLVFFFLDTVLELGFLNPIYSLAVLLPALAVAVRRMHDIGRSGWWVLICLVPVVGTVILIVWLATDSQPGQNLYGANPKEGGATPPPAAPTL